MRKNPDLSINPAKDATSKKIHVERRFYGERSAEDMLKSLIRAHSASM